MIAMNWRGLLDAFLHPSNPYVRLALVIIGLIVLIAAIALLSGSATICHGIGYSRECGPPE